MAHSREEILEQVKGALSEKLGIEESEITEEASFEEDLGADSLDLVEVVMDLEDQFGLKIPRRRRPRAHDRRQGDRLRHRPPGVARKRSPGRPGSAELGRLIARAPGDGSSRSSRTPPGRRTRAESYERLEFLGDSVLELAIARSVFDRFEDASEGRLAKIRAHVVSRQTCAVVAKELGLGERLARVRRRHRPG